MNEKRYEEKKERKRKKLKGVKEQKLKTNG